VPCRFLQIVSFLLILPIKKNTNTY